MASLYADGLKDDDLEKLKISTIPALIILMHKRIYMLEDALSMLSRQTYKNFDIYISNSFVENLQQVKDISAKFNNLNIKEIVNATDDTTCFRRFPYAKDIRNRFGTEAFMLLDEDLIIPDNYIEKTIENYEPKTYKSAFAWQTLYEKSKPYDYLADRNRVSDVLAPADYAGCGVSIFDGSILDVQEFLDINEEDKVFDDVWLSYFVATKMHNWKVGYSGATFSFNEKASNDPSAIWVNFKDQKIAYVKKMIDSGWNLSK
jgi:hypothetical protein